MSSNTMRAVVFKGVKSVAVEDRPLPTILDPHDIIVKVKYTALCGRFVKSPGALIDQPTHPHHSASSTFSVAISHQAPASSWAMNSQVP